jgi:hypothetical protein
MYSNQAWLAAPPLFFNDETGVPVWIDRCCLRGKNPPASFVL